MKCLGLYYNQIEKLKDKIFPEETTVQGGDTYAV